MKKDDAIAGSQKRTAVRQDIEGDRKTTYIAYEDGSIYMLVSDNGKINYFLSGQLAQPELREVGATQDWESSQMDL